MQWKTTSNKKLQKLKIVFKPPHKTISFNRNYSRNRVNLCPLTMQICVRETVQLPVPEIRGSCDLVKYEHKVYGFIINTTFICNILLGIQIILLKNVTTLYIFMIHTERSVIQQLSYNSVLRHACTMHNHYHLLDPIH
jgi:hypothetical protein